ncbi:MunI family type II restriction endonuclease [Patescibacteria group bacterium]|nr:MunI family type II restriction endonuclease [Patescibacteria group bacterium]
MGTKELRKREIWQDVSGPKAGVAEKNFYEVFLEDFEGSDFKIRPNPNEFNNIYFDVKLSKNVLAEIYTPDLKKWRHGIVPDYAIDNLKTKKTLYVEVKRQDGWVEGKSRSAGRGNAHERSCKFFTPGLLEILKEHGKLGDAVLPFWVVFQGDITRDPCRVREITLWYNGYPAHFFMWRDLKNKQPLIDHFNKKLKHLLT